MSFLIRRINSPFGGGGNPAIDFIFSVTVTAGQTFTLPLVETTGVYNFEVDWGNGDPNQTITVWNQLEATHTYPVGGTFDIILNGNINGWSVNNYADKLKITEVKQWGTLLLGSGSAAFYGCANLTISATDVLDTSVCTTLFSAFRGCSSITTIPSLNDWDVSLVDNMNYTFANSTSFDQAFNSWDVRVVTNMQGMFDGCTSFNGDITGWTPLLVTNMGWMFRDCVAFNQDISGWDVSNVSLFGESAGDRGMFGGCTIFNQDLSAWNTTSATNMRGMFRNCTALNQSFNNWDVSLVTTTAEMFQDCTGLTTNSMTGWVLTSLTTMFGMFDGCTSFNGNVTDWTLSSVTDMSYMFRDCVAFNQDISGWNVSSVSLFGNPVAADQGMFGGCTIFNQDLSTWITTSATNMRGMFRNCTAFDQNIGGWNTSLVIDMRDMLSGATSFNQNLATFDVTALTTAAAMLDNTSISTTNYDNLLVGWEAQTLIPSGFLGAAGLTYSAAVSAAATARGVMVSTDLWTITGDAPFP